MRHVFMLFMIVLMLALVLPAFAQPVADQFPVISADALKAELDSGKKVFLVDARSKGEYAKGHLPGAINIPPDAYRSMVEYLPKDKGFPLVIYCRGWG